MLTKLLQIIVYSLLILFVCTGLGLLLNSVFPWDIFLPLFCMARRFIYLFDFFYDMDYLCIAVSIMFSAWSGVQVFNLAFWFVKIVGLRN